MHRKLGRTSVWVLMDRNPDRQLLEAKGRFLMEYYPLAVSYRLTYSPAKKEWLLYVVG